MERRLGGEGICSLANYCVATEETQSNWISEFRDFVWSFFPKAILSDFYFTVVCLDFVNILRRRLLDNFSEHVGLKLRSRCNLLYNQFSKLDDITLYQLWALLKCCLLYVASAIMYKQHIQKALPNTLFSSRKHAYITFTPLNPTFI